MAAIIKEVPVYRVNQLAYKTSPFTEGFGQSACTASCLLSIKKHISGEGITMEQLVENGYIRSYSDPYVVSWGDVGRTEKIELETAYDYSAKIYEALSKGQASYIHYKKKVKGRPHFVLACRAIKYTDREPAVSPYDVIVMDPNGGEFKTFSYLIGNEIESIYFIKTITNYADGAGGDLYGGGAEPGNPGDMGGGTNPGGGGTTPTEPTVPEEDYNRAVAERDAARARRDAAVGAMNGAVAARDAAKRVLDEETALRKAAEQRVRDTEIATDLLVANTKSKLSLLEAYTKSLFGNVQSRVSKWVMDLRTALLELLRQLTQKMDRVRCPATGRLRPFEESVEAVFTLFHREEALQAKEYDGLMLNSGGYDVKKAEAYMYDMNAKKYLM